MNSKIGIKLFADTANINELKDLYKLGLLDGITTNPSLMRQAGISEYEKSARQILEAIPDLPISFEVFADDFEGMIQQGKQIAKWHSNVVVKVPIINTKGEVTRPVIEALSQAGIPLNITAVFGTEFIAKAIDAINPDVPSIISVFAGRIADIGIAPLPIIDAHAKLIKDSGCNSELLWASTREFYNIFEARDHGCTIVTAPGSVLKKVSNLGQTLEEITFSAVQTFYNDAQASGFSL